MKKWWDKYRRFSKNRVPEDEGEMERHDLKETGQRKDIPNKLVRPIMEADRLLAAPGMVGSRRNSIFSHNMSNKSNRSTPINPVRGDHDYKHTVHTEEHKDSEDNLEPESMASNTYLKGDDSPVSDKKKKDQTVPDSKAAKS